jgi:hypothetical protein
MRDKVTGQCRRLHNEALNDLYSSTNYIRVIKSIMNIGGEFNMYGGEEMCIQSFDGEN